VIFGRNINKSMIKIILDLCGGTGSWSKPYQAAGCYDVRIITLPAQDVCTYIPPTGVHGVLAAPPCTEFSLAKNGHTTSRDFKEGLRIVDACIRIIWRCRPLWWALENPIGHLGKFLGPHEWWFQPWWFGDPWTKRTALWGRFNPAQRKYQKQSDVMGPDQIHKSKKSISVPYCLLFTG